MRGKNDGGIRLLWRSRVHVGAVAFDRHESGVVAKFLEFLLDDMSDRRFVSGDRFDIHELARECNDVHEH